jgi:hypothetical protein
MPAAKTYRSSGVKKVVRSRNAGRNDFILKNSLPASEVGQGEWRRGTAKHDFGEKRLQTRDVRGRCALSHGNRDAGFHRRCRQISLEF